MVLATLRMTIPPPKLKEALRIFRSTAEQCRVLSGCLSCHIYEDLQEESVIMLQGRWKSQADLDEHLRSDEYHHVLLAMEMALEQPEILFDHIEKSSGIETVEKARNTTRKGKNP